MRVDTVPAAAAAAARPPSSHPRLEALLARARAGAAADPPVVGIVHPCDALALEAAAAIDAAGIARPLLIGPCDEITRVADAAGIDLARLEIVHGGLTATEAAMWSDSAFSRVRMALTGSRLPLRASRIACSAAAMIWRR